MTEAANRGARIVKRVDHVWALVADPPGLFELFTTRFDLPVIVTYARHPGFASGAVSLGNVMFECLDIAPGREIRAPRTGLGGLAFEPTGIEGAARELARRGIAHSAPTPTLGDRAGGPVSEADIFQRARRGSGRRALWTNIYLGGFLGDREQARQYSKARPDSRGSRLVARLGSRLMTRRRFADAVVARMTASTPYVFLCEYEFVDIDQARLLYREELERRSGGPLGLERVREVVLGAQDPEAEARGWQPLLDPIELAEDGLWKLGDGPSVRLVEDEANRIKELVCEVRSLDQARAFLDREGMLGAASATGTMIDPAILQGVNIRLVEAAATDIGGAPHSAASATAIRSGPGQ